VVPEPGRLTISRVLRPGGEIVLVNHVSGKDDAIALFEAWLDRHMAPKLGWRPQFPGRSL
jgi:phosphatidylethanolamine/phosphatidyl-N-methylethanolamine N-methyltransferase